ncbi:hypothetical protein Q5P01_008508 [Channa striata]|uniref:Ig-like domain-containing protein n=1 Tax=Channa striata TaxID=64152 RepID=A0AA88SWK5_CHASR|nr:hypothetical protein Q5P01_008508 [Channa striata]
MVTLWVTLLLLQQAYSLVPVVTVQLDEPVTFTCVLPDDGLNSKQLFWTISSSDAGTYYCAVATCGQILFGNGTKLDIDENSMWLQFTKTILCLLCAALAPSFLVIFICTIMCDCCNDALKQNSDGPNSQQVKHFMINFITPKLKDEEMWVYSAATFTMMNPGCATMNDAKSAERERIYRALV